MRLFSTLLLILLLITSTTYADQINSMTASIKLGGGLNPAIEGAYTDANDIFFEAASGFLIGAEINYHISSNLALGILYHTISSDASGNIDILGFPTDVSAEESSSTFALKFGFDPSDESGWILKGGIGYTSIDFSSKLFIAGQSIEMKSNPAGISWLLTAGYKIYFSENISAALEAEYLTLTETMYSYVNGEKGNKLSDSPEVISITLGLGYSF